jgi:AcrR family transcriptional regulator
MGITERKEREKLRRKKDIINSAESVFFSKGFESATMDDIAEKVELSKGTLYLYFKGKEDLHMAVALKAIGLMNTMTNPIDDMKLNALDKLVKLGLTFIDFSKKFPDHMNAILLSEGVDFNNNSMSENDLRDVIYHVSPVRLVLKFIDQGVEEQCIRNDISPIIIANTLWIQMLGVIQMALQRRGLFEMIKLTPEALYKNHIELVLNGIKS